MHRAFLAALLCISLISACSKDKQTAVLRVFAASSLTDAFGSIEKMFEANHEQIDAQLNLLSSSDLAAQIEQGAPADVFASADLSNMKRLEDKGLVAKTPTVFARNRMTMIVESGNPKDIKSLDDLEDPTLVVSLAAPGVPAGDYAQDVFRKAGVQVKADSQEQDVRAVVTRVATGEADAGVVYITDAQSDTEIDTVPIPTKFNVIANYPIASIKDSAERTLADEFVDLVLSTRGRAVLHRYGFENP